MTKVWPLQDAKARLSELVRAAEKEPQIISLRGVPKVEVRAVETGKKRKKQMTLLEALRACPKDAEFKLPPRRKEPMRKVDLG